jgi:hypothetical protein
MRKHICNIISVIWVLSLLSIPAFSQVSELYKTNWDESEVQRRIADGIKQNRMGMFTGSRQQR